MNKTKILALAASVAALSFSFAANAKDVKIASQNTSYSSDDVQKLASTAVKMGVQEPVSLSLAGSNLTVSGSGSTKCIFKVGSGDKPQIQGLSCK